MGSIRPSSSARPRRATAVRRSICAATAREVAERMGILDDVKAAHTGARGMAFVDGDGQRVASIGADLFGDSGGPIAELEILRGDLVRILHDVTEDHVAYHFDESITAIEQTSDGVEVTFRRGAPRTFDLVIGADGLHSNVRRLVFGPEEAFVRDFGCHVCIFTAPLRERLDGWTLMHSIAGENGARGKTAGIYPVRDEPRGKAMFYFESPEHERARADRDHQKRLLAEAFVGARWEVPHLIEAMWDAPDFYFDRVCQVHMERWSSGRVALLGDAAYCGSPLGGNGTSMALVGAYVLAGELALAEGDHVTAFARYEAEMRDYVSQCQRFAKGGVGSMLPKSRAGLWLRNQSIRMLPFIPFRSKLVGSLEGAASAVRLKSYSAGASPARSRAALSA
jgi:2-polyprenyl-6-methoxyphenol hydroxylase-like FAD-dependent oxidoreductase